MAGAELLITDVTAVTVDGERRIIDDAAILVEGDRIAAIDRSDVLARRVPDVPRLDGAGMVAIPGLIDTHGHADQSILRGTTDDLHWVPFLDEWIDPYLRDRTTDDLVAAYELAGLEMIRSGTTCFVSPNVDPSDDLHAIETAIAALGLRAVLARWTEPNEPVAAAVDAVRRWDGSAGGLMRMWFGLMVPRRPGDACVPEFYRAITRSARELDVGVTYHFCSEIEDAEFYETEFGQRPAEWARDHGVLGPNVLLINGCWLSEVEIAILSATRTGVVFSPSATMKMATGVTPVVELLAAGVVVSLGTDGGANNNSHDMVREMKAGCLIQNAANRRAGALTAEQALELATVGGARAIGREHELGSLEVGKRADVVLVDLSGAHVRPLTDPVSNLVFAAHGGDVDTVLVDGRIVMRHRRLPGVDDQRILADAERAAARVVGTVTPTPSTRWPRH